MAAQLQVDYGGDIVTTAGRQISLSYEKINARAQFGMTSANHKIANLTRCCKLAVFATLGLLASADVETQGRPYFGRTTDATPVAVAIQDKNEIVRLTIPKMYLTFSKNWEGGDQTGITLETVYPSMAALSATGSSTVGIDVVVINLQSFAYTGADYSVSKVRKTLEAKQWVFVENVTPNNTRSYRLYVNKEDVEKRNDQSRFIKEFLVPDGDDIYFECVRELSNPLAGCSGFVNYGENLSLRFQFKRTQFDKWPDIREGVVKLLDSFRQPARRPPSGRDR